MINSMSVGEKYQTGYGYESGENYEVWESVAY